MYIYMYKICKCKYFPLSPSCENSATGNKRSVVCPHSCLETTQEVGANLRKTLRFMGTRGPRATERGDGMGSLGRKLFA